MRCGGMPTSRIPAAVFGWPHVDLALGPRDRLPDLHDACRQIKVAAPQAAHLPGTEPTPPGQEHGQAVSRRKFQELVELRPARPARCRVCGGLVRHSGSGRGSARSSPSSSASWQNGSEQRVGVLALGGPILTQRRSSTSDESGPVRGSATAPCPASAGSGSRGACCTPRASEGSGPAPSRHRRAKPARKSISEPLALLLLRRTPALAQDLALDLRQPVLGVALPDEQVWRLVPAGRRAPRSGTDRRPRAARCCRRTVAPCLPLDPPGTSEDLVFSVSR